MKRLARTPQINDARSNATAGGAQSQSAILINNRNSSVKQLKLLKQVDRAVQAKKSSGHSFVATRRGILQLMKDVYLGLGDKGAWKEIIDGQFHKLGPMTFDKALHNEEDAEDPISPEEGYLDSVMQGRAFVANSLGERQLDADFLDEIHAKTVLHKNEVSDRDDENYFRKGYRDENDKEISVSFSREMDYEKGGPSQALKEIDPGVARVFRFRDEYDLTQYPATGEDEDFIIGFEPKTEDQLKDEVNKIAKSYYEGLEKMGKEDDKLKLIASTHRKLENLHPFIDANTRTNRLVLHKLLVENGMSPVILENPLSVHLQSDDQWAQTLRDGMKKWQDEKDSMK